MQSTPPSTHLYRGLPNELLLHIKECIPTSDLRTHVCYYHTCRTIAAFYGDDSQQADFWRRSCLLAGLNFVGTDSSYKDIAFECISKDGFCLHPACGGSLLDWNAKQIEYAMERYGWDPEDGPIDANFSEFEMGLTVEEQDIFPELQTNRILNFIAFDKENHLPFASGCTFLRCYDPNGYRLPINKRSLREHPIASRCLGAFPSVTRLSIHYSSSTHCEPELIHNPNGIRVMDIVHKIQINLDSLLTVNELCGLLDPAGGCFEALIPEGTQVAPLQMLSRWQTLRGLWALSSLDMLSYDGIDEHGPAFGLMFSPLSSALFEKEFVEELSVHG